MRARASTTTITRSGVVWWALAVALCGPARGETLADAISLAYRTNPALLAQRAGLRALDESVVQARSAYGPSVTASAQSIYADSRVDEPGYLGGTNRVRERARTGGASISIDQRLFSGGQVSATTKSAEADVLAARQNLRTAEAQILQNVILAYISVRRDQQLVQLADQNLKRLNSELEDTYARFAAREVTLTDRAQAQARVAAARTQMATAQERLTISRAQYLQWVGQNPGELAEEPALKGVPETVEQAFDVAEINNPSLLAATWAEAASRERVAAAKAENGLSLSLHSELSSQPESLYTPNMKNQGVTVEAVISKPLFTAGLNSSRVRQALEQNNRDRLLIENTRRAVIQSVAQVWSQLVTARISLKSDEDQLKAARVAYAGAREEQKIGLRSTIDVLNAEQELQTAETALAQARYEEYAASTGVLAAMGLLEGPLLAPDAVPYSPAAAYRRVASKGQVPWVGLVQALDSLGAPKVRKGTAPAGAIEGVRPDITIDEPSPPFVPPPTQQGLRASLAGTPAADTDPVASAATGGKASALDKSVSQALEVRGGAQSATPPDSQRATLGTAQQGSGSGAEAGDLSKQGEDESPVRTARFSSAATREHDPNDRGPARDSSKNAIAAAVLAPPTSNAQGRNDQSENGSHAERSVHGATLALPNRSGAVVQVGAFPNREEADRGWQSIAAMLPDQTSRRDKRIEVVQVNGKIFYRSLVGGFASRADAISFCHTLKERAHACFVRG